MLQVQPVTFKEACRFVSQFHRHHKPPAGCLFCIAANDGERVRGVVIVSRPVACCLQDGYTAEVTRCCTDGAQNACSLLYAAAWRACRSIGYRRLITYIREDERGTSLSAAGWSLVGHRPARSWEKQSGRPRVDRTEVIGRYLWEKMK